MTQENNNNNSDAKGKKKQATDGIVYQPMFTESAMTDLLNGNALIAKGQELVCKALAQMTAFPTLAPSTHLPLFNTSEALSTPKPTQKRKRAEKPKRLTPYLAFFSDLCKTNRSEHASHQEFLAHVSNTWKSMPEEERKKYQDRAEEMNKHYREEFDAAHATTETGETPVKVQVGGSPATAVSAGLPTPPKEAEGAPGQAATTDAGGEVALTTVESTDASGKSSDKAEKKKKKKKDREEKEKHKEKKHKKQKTETA